MQYRIHNLHNDGADRWVSPPTLRRLLEFRLVEVSSCPGDVARYIDYFQYGNDKPIYKTIPRYIEVFDENGTKLNIQEIKDIIAEAPKEEPKYFYWWERNKAFSFIYRYDPVPFIGKSGNGFTFSYRKVKHLGRNIINEPLIRTRHKNRIKKELASWDASFQSRGKNRSWKSYRKHQYKENKCNAA